MAGPVPHNLLPPCPSDELWAALAPLPGLATGDPDHVFALAQLLHPAELQQLVAIFPIMLPALISRAQALARAMEAGWLWPAHYFGASCSVSAKPTMWALLGPALVDGGVDLFEVQRIISVFSEREQHCFAAFLGLHFHQLVGLAIFRGRHLQPAWSWPPHAAPASTPRDPPVPPAAPPDAEPESDSCHSPGSTSESGWVRQCPSHRGPDPTGVPSAVPHAFLLWASSRDGDTGCVAACLRNLDNGHVDDTHQGWTSLLKAAENDHAGVVGLLLDAQAYVNAATGHGRSAASIAVAPPDGRGPSTKSLLLLLQAGANLSAKSDTGKSPITYAMESSPALGFALAEHDPVQGLAD